MTGSSYDPLPDAESRRGRKPRTVFGVLALVAVATAVCLWAFTREDKLPQAGTVVAEIRFQSDSPGLLSGPASPELPAARQQITSAANLCRALDETGFQTRHEPGGEILRQVRDRLKITASQPSIPGQTRFRVGYTDSMADRAQRLVLHLATSYADQCRAELETAAQRTYVDARDAADLAHREMNAATTRLDAFLARHFAEHRTLAHTTAARAAARAAQASPPDSHVARRPTRAGSPSPRMVDNPERIDLEGQLARLAVHRENLLTDRTPLHPEVLNLDSRIADLRKIVAGVPRQIAALPSDSSPESPGRDVGTLQPDLEPPADPALATAPGRTVQQHVDAVATYETLRAAVEQTSIDYDQLARLERDAWQRRTGLPRIDVQLTPTVPADRPASDGTGLALVAVLAGVALALGAGMIWSGTAVEPVFNSVVEARAKLSVPVVGVLPDVGPDEPSEDSSGRIAF